MRKLSIIKYGIFFFVIMAASFSRVGDISARLSWEYYYERGQTQDRLGMYNEAALSLVNCLDLNPKFYQAANLLGDVYCKLNRKHLAIPWYEKSLAVNDRQADIHGTLGEVYEFFSENDLAYGHFSKAVAIDPENERAHCRLVRHCVLREDREAAARHFEISSRKGKAGSRKRLAAAARAVGGGNDKKAAGIYVRVIEKSPCVIEAYLDLYEIHSRRKDFAAAAGVLERLKKVKPDHEKAYVLLGYVYFTRKMPGQRKLRIDQALANLKKAVELNPDNFDACYSISEIYAYIKKDIEAREWEEKGIKAEERADAKKKP